MDATSLDGVWRRFAHPDQKAIVATQRGKHVLDDFVSRLELEERVQVGGAHGAVRQRIGIAVLGTEEQFVVRRQMSLHHHVHPFGKRVPVRLKVLAPFHGFGHDQQAAGFSGKLVDKVHIDALLGFGLEVSLHRGVGRLDLGVGRGTHPAGRLLIDEHIVVLIDHRKRCPEKCWRCVGFAVLGLSSSRSAALGHLLFRQDGHLCPRLENIRPA